MSNPLNLPIRPRRLRMHPLLRQSVASVRLSRKDFIVPLFVCEGSKQRIEIPSMPGVYQMSIDLAADWLDQRAAEGFPAYLVFGVIPKQKKDEKGSHATDPENVVCKLLRETKRRKNPMAAIPDECFCEYTSHGHCGIMTSDSTTVDNDATLPLLAQQAVNHARAGADLVAPSGMMDGGVGAIRSALDANHFSNVGILAYSVKYASAFYGPFRDAADCAPQFGDRRSYQMNPAGGIAEAIREAKLDIDQGADMVMVKPAGPYLDVLSALRREVNVPLAAYQVSGEYSMLMAAIRNGWLDHDAAILESLLAIKRAGAEMIISYFAPQIVTLIS